MHPITPPPGPPAPPPSRVAAVRVLFVGLLGLGGWLGHRGEGGGAVITPLRFEELAESSGLTFRHEAARFHPSLEHIAPQISSLGASVSVVDVDGDGDLDIHTTSSAHGTANALFLNDGSGRFTDVAERAGLADLNRDGEGCSQAAVFADYDADGDQDLYLVRWGRPLLLRNEGDLRFVDVTAEAGLDLWMNASCAVWFDGDRDGDLDLFVGGYYPADVDLWNPGGTRVLHESFEFATNGGLNRLFRNEGDGRFSDVTEASGLTGRRWTLAAAAVDLDEDGWQDLYLANDFGPEQLFLSTGDADGDGLGELAFAARLGAGLEEQAKSGMCVTLGNLDNDGRLSVFVTNISERAYVFQGNNLRVNHLPESGRFLEVASGPVQNCGWAWGADFGDLDLDGYQDLFVVNGFYSGDPEREYWYEMAKLGGATEALIADADNWPPFDGRSLSGHQRSRVLLNQAARFRDVAPFVGVDDRLDGRAVVLADLTGDGSLDAVVANQRGPLLLYRSPPLEGRHWLALDLEATRGHPDAIGAEVSLHWSGGVVRQVVSAGMGFASQVPLRLHFGLGDDPTIDQLVIRWPSGQEQVLTDLAADRLHRVEEPR